MGQWALQDVAAGACTLQQHALAAPPSSAREASPDDKNRLARPEGALWSILRTPAPDLAPAELRLVAREVVWLDQRLDDARAIICPKETFAFRRYRAAMVAARAADDGAPPDPKLAKETARSSEDDATATVIKRDTCKGIKATKVSSF